ncbi:transposable element Tcb2 transposase [Trichonephila clavipes]|nr:transposable element Tcb2 transposase [Trichonephila clavipes]
MPAGWRGWFVARLLHLRLRVRPRPKSVDFHDVENPQRPCDMIIRRNLFSLDLLPFASNNCPIVRHPYIGSTFTTGLCVSPYHRKARGRTVVIAVLITCSLVLKPTLHRRRLEWSLAQRDWRTTERNHVICSDESKFSFGGDKNRIRMRRPRCERLNLAFALQRHTTPTTGAMAWDAITIDTWLPLILIHIIKTSQRYVPDISQPHVLPLPVGALFQQDNAHSNTVRVSQNCLRHTHIPLP